MQVCMKRQQAMIAPIPFPSSSSDKVYKVYLYREGRKLPMCTCMPYLRSRKKIVEQTGQPTDSVAGTCRHIREAHAGTCDWSEEDGGYQFSGVCPKCGERAVEVDEDGHVVETSKDDAVQALLELRAKRSGTDLPAAPEVPKPPRFAVEAAYAANDEPLTLPDSMWLEVHVVVDRDAPECDPQRAVFVTLDKEEAGRVCQVRNAGGFDPSDALSGVLATVDSAPVDGGAT